MIWRYEQQVSIAIILHIWQKLHTYYGGIDRKQSVGPEESSSFSTSCSIKNVRILGYVTMAAVITILYSCCLS